MLIKPNMGFNVIPELAAKINPLLVKRIIKIVLMQVPKKFIYLTTHQQNAITGSIVIKTPETGMPLDQQELK